MAAKAKADGKTGIKAAEPVEFYISRVKASITNEAELDEFLEKLKTEMLKLLQDKDHYY